MAPFSARKFFYLLPPAWRFLARRLYFLPSDLVEGWTGQRDALTPPKGLIFTGSGDYVRQGKELVQRFVELGGLQPQHQVLDIGSGIGRVAVPLTDYLSPEGGYEGFDVIRLGVKWCRRHISRRFPNFQFQYIPLNNDLYRSSGKDAANFRFPYPDDRFDFVVVNSVFTHLLPAEVDNYLSEIRRVMKPGGRCYGSFFLLNRESKELMAEQPDFQFPHDHGHYRLMEEGVRAANVAFEESYLLQLISKHHLKVVSTHYGHWCGRPKGECLDFQDFYLIA